MIWHPYAETFPLLEGQELLAFEADLLASDGNRDPITFRVLVDVSTGLTRQYLDGRNRARSCLKLGLPLAELMVYVEDEEVKAYIDSKNLHRRHLTTDWRRGQVAELTQQGLSSRAIAAAVGCDPKTVLKDQKALEQQAAVDTGAAEAMPTSLPGKPLPEKVLGQDGKEHPRHKAAAEKPKPKKNGAQLFDWKLYGQEWWRVYRQIDNIKRAAKQHGPDLPQHEALQRMLCAFDDAFRKWFEQAIPGAKAPERTARAQR